jgi:hypothetical protein
MSNQTIDSIEVKAMKEKVSDFGKMAGEIFNVFSSLKNIKITSFFGIGDHLNMNSFSVLPKNGKPYIEIEVLTKDQSEFPNKHDLVDLLQSALKESGIVQPSTGIESSLNQFLSRTNISYVHNMVGSTQKNLLKDFDNFIEQNTNHELTFSQKLNKFKKKH